MQALADQIAQLSARYNVDPIIFGILYVGGIPIFLAVVGWLAARARHGKSVVPQGLLLLYLAIQPYLYVAVFGENLPRWVYGVIAAMIALGAWQTTRTISKRKAEATALADPAARHAAATAAEDEQG